MLHQHCWCEGFNSAEEPDANTGQDSKGAKVADIALGVTRYGSSHSKDAYAQDDESKGDCCVDQSGL